MTFEQLRDNARLIALDLAEVRKLPEGDVIFEIETQGGRLVTDVSPRAAYDYLTALAQQVAHAKGLGEPNGPG